MDIKVGQGRIIGVMAASGIAAAALVLLIPVGLIETVVASSGLSEALPAAAPPLGMKARLLIAAFAALMAIGIVGALRRDRPQGDKTHGNSERGRRVQGVMNMGFAFSKLTALARGRVAAAARDVPFLRRADAHPDAPARAPIFASRDFDGLDIFPNADLRRRAAGPHPEPELPTPAIAPAIDLAAPKSPSPMTDSDLCQPTFLRPAEQSIEEAPSTDIAHDPEPTRGLSITQLTERLERGLAQRSRTPAYSGEVRVIADMPVMSAIPVRDAVAQDADQALRAALGALRSMAGRAR